MLFLLLPIPREFAKYISAVATIAYIAIQIRRKPFVEIEIEKRIGWVFTHGGIIYSGLFAPGIWYMSDENDEEPAWVVYVDHYRIARITKQSIDKVEFKKLDRFVGSFKWTMGQQVRVGKNIFVVNPDLGERETDVTISWKYALRRLIGV